MKTYKLVREDFGSLNNDYDRVIYTEDWQDIPCKGAYCSETGEGICAGGIGRKLIELEVEEEREKPEINGVQCWGRVRMIREIPLPEEYDKAWDEYVKAGEEWDNARVECDKAREEWDNARVEYDKAWDEYDRAWEEWERIIIDVIKGLNT